jgi:hypothetical protein
MKKREWTDQDRADFITAWMAGDSRARIAARFKVCTTNVTYWRKKFGLAPRPKRVKRGRYAKTAAKGNATCLTCDRPFMSEGIHNRVCPDCRGTVEFTGGSGIAPAPVYHVRHRGAS